MTRTLAGLLGSISLTVGVFAPLAAITFVGSVNALSNSPILATGLLLVAALATLCVLCRREKPLLWLGLLALALAAIAFIKVLIRLGATEGEIQRGANDPALNSAIHMAMTDSRLEWGWAPLIVGAMLLVGAGLFGRRSNTTPL